MGNEGVRPRLVCLFRVREDHLTQPQHLSYSLLPVTTAEKSYVIFTAMKAPNDKTPPTPRSKEGFAHTFKPQIFQNTYMAHPSLHPIYQPLHQQIPPPPDSFLPTIPPMPQLWRPRRRRHHMPNPSLHPSRMMVHLRATDSPIRTTSMINPGRHRAR